MAKKNDAAKIESLKLREGGMILPDIVKQTGLSKATLERLFKRHKLLDEKLRLSHINNETPQIKVDIDDKNANQTIKSEVGVPKGKTEDIKNDAFTGSHVTHNKNGSIEIENAHTTEIPKSNQKDSVSERRVNAVGMGQTKPASVSRKPDIDAPENILDQFFSRGLVSTLVPVGLVVAGYMLSKKDKEQDNTQGEAW